METVKQAIERLGLTTTNTEDLQDAVIRIEETATETRLYIQPGFFISAWHETEDE